MNWYKIFYWFTVADGVKNFFDAASNFAFTVLIISIVLTVVTSIGRAFQISGDSTHNDEEDRKSPDIRAWEKVRAPAMKVMWWAAVITIITWTAYVMIPSKKDAVLIIAGGAVGSFITSDSSAKQIPAEVSLLVKEKLRSEINELRAGNVTDTLAQKTKEQLIELLKKKE